jgi:hypothetical protein
LIGFLLLNDVDARIVEHRQDALDLSEDASSDGITALSD